MNAAIWRSLLWKEWREHRWKLAALVAVVIGLHVWVLDATEPGPAHYANAFLATLYLVLPIGSVFIAIGLAAGEQSQRTASFIQSTPIDLRWLAAIKLAIGVSIVTVTIALSAAMTRGLIALADAYQWQPDTSSLKSLESVRYLVETGHWFSTALLITCAVSASIILWIAALAVNSKSEVRAGAIGLVVFAVTWTLAIWMFSQFFVGKPVETLPQLFLGSVAAILPGGFVVAVGIMETCSGQPLLVIPAFLAAHVPLAWWYITRFGHTGDRERARLNDAAPLVAPAPVWLKPARRSPLTALLWKHARECAAIVFAGAVGALGLTIMLVCMNYQHQHVTNSHNLSILTSESILIAFTTLGSCAGLVSGAGVLTSELEPRLFTFWRTRPISIDLWFAIAFVSGLALLVLVFGVPIAVTGQFIGALPGMHGPLPPLLPILVLSYASGAFTASFVRNPVYASILGFCVMMFVFAGGSSEWIDIPAAWVGVATLAVSALLGVAAWVCVRNDWSLRLS